MPESQAQHTAMHHERVRRQHSDELAEDYVEAIYELQRQGQLARVMNLQEIFGVSHVSVIRALKRFEGRGLLTRSRTKGIQLTTAGRKMAKNAAERHALVVNFLLKLGVSGSQAQIDAEGIEHHISKETIEAMRKFIRTNQIDC
ncbi:iron dependent repressor, metal binding and dimerization domain protein [Rubellicoccus peritrichatus]|uniref:Transcriptional regulator MntR n=1 Tax=Rubellicoccus peritrichatus TaxID=3080537 RepID=A0AAQ3LAF1_9BACT|nr:iron dependent repressor, metal binding and dimerization domain protein [Puniceicoccus sp. CR14]WOO42230.1 iron dependent repressor, metal binding and dimerization domain protein [Puniceicoccus sp. CR14]